jgi:hypothetical protein
VPPRLALSDEFAKLRGQVVLDAVGTRKKADALARQQ